MVVNKIVSFPDELSLNRYQQLIENRHKTIFSFAYQQDLDNAYAFYCARYENISYDNFLKLGLFEFKKKLNSIPKDEPLYEIIKSRAINVGKIKDKNEKKYWQELKRINEIPKLFLSNDEIDYRLKETIKENKIDNLGGKL